MSKNETRPPARPGPPATAGKPARSPHPATVAQRKPAGAGGGARPPHPATVAQPKRAMPDADAQRRGRSVQRMDMDIQIDPANDVIDWIRVLGKTSVMGNAFMTHGGWEGWLQVELALHLVATSPHTTTVQREEKVYGTDEAADLIVASQNQLAYVVELKCQGVNRKRAEFLALVKKDIVKVRKLPGDVKGVALAITMTDELYNYFGEQTGDIPGRNITRLGAWEGGDIFVFAWSNR